MAGGAPLQWRVMTTSQPNDLTLRSAPLEYLGVNSVRVSKGG